MPRGGRKGGHKGRVRMYTSPEEIDAQMKAEKERKKQEQEEVEGAAQTDLAEEKLPASGSDDSDDENSLRRRAGVEGLIEIENPNRVAQKSKKVTQIEVDEPRQLSRREREEIEKQKAKERYMKMHLAGKTDQAKADLARLAIIRKQREEAARKKEEEKKGVFHTEVKPDCYSSSERLLLLGTAHGLLDAPGQRRSDPGCRKDVFGAARHLLTSGRGHQASHCGIQGNKFPLSVTRETATMSLTNGHSVSKETWDSHNRMMLEPLSVNDSEMFFIIKKEKHRQKYGLELMASENFTSRAVLEALGSCMNNRYFQNPGAISICQRYDGIIKHDELVRLCQKRALEAYGLASEKWGVNVQPYSGSPANFAVYTAVVEPHGRIMGLDPPDGGHLTHGFMTDKKKISPVSIFFETMPYKVNPETGYIDYDRLQENARLFHPKLIIAGTSCYSRNIDYARMKQIADENGAYLMGDMAHISGLVAAGVVPSPFDYCDIVTTTTHKTLRGCRAGLIFYRKGVRSVDAEGKETLYNLESLINQTVSPGLQGAQHNHAIAGVTVALKQAMTPEFKAYQMQVLVNCKSLSSALIDHDYKIVTGGSDNHLILLDLRSKGTDGMRAHVVLDACAITCSKHACPGEDIALCLSGLRLGTPALTSRGLLEEDFKKVAEFIHRGIVLLTLEVQRSLDPKAPLKEFIQALNQGEKFQQRVAEIRAEVEVFSDFISFAQVTSAAASLI
ncbi:hypothetical protein L3Q82_014420 [Scortum barcoo]|uniref:Uncharacterized protein n=1 Tax=Scortum barcoo TaxID=214431 RepID=A0ACB8VX06_9TELE|nr:hypothetical protein L3Q82_014420 [Scortum barcoo]